MVWLRLFSLLAGLVLSTAACPAPAVALFYGARLPVAELRAFDIAVVDPDHGHDPQKYQVSGSELYAYVAVAEAHPGRAYFPEMPATWKIGGNADWDSIVIDQTPTEWPAFFAERVVGPLWARGYRGFFLDTLDSYRLAPNFDETAQQAGLIRVIETLHRRFPGIKLILNRGFEIVPHVRDKIQMVAAESLYRGWNARHKRYEEVAAGDREWLLGQLDKIRQRDGLPILAIDYVPPHDRATTRATAEKIRQLGFIPWVSDRALNSVGIGAIESMPRRVLFVHDAREAPSFKFGNAHRFLEMPLNHLGYVVDYASVRDDIPSDIQADRYVGVVTWFSGSLTDTDGKRLVRWLRTKRQEGLPILAIGNFGYAIEGAFGREFRLASAEAASGKLTIAERDPMIGFETQPLPGRSRQTPIRSLDPADRILLGLRDARNAHFVGAAITEWGGFVLDPFAIDEVPGSDQHRWVIDPFALLQAAFRLPAMPVPDVTTENGRRLLFSHIDGDGFPSVAELPDRPLAAEVLYRDVLQKYRIPTTVSVIESEIAPDGLYPALSPRLETVARRMFALPHVEIASHSYSHPFKWDTVRHGVFANAQEEYYHLEIPGYKMDLHREIVGSVDYIQRRLAPAGKPVRIMLWSGDTTPGLDALRIADQAGLLNMNGGDTYISRRNPSLTAVGPLGIRIGNYLQVYAPIANENIFTNLWRGPFYGYETAIETFAMTGSPRRLKPVGIYYHTYSASKRSGLGALDKAFSWAAGQPLFPVFASDYIGKVQAFQEIAIARDGDGWRIRSDGRLRTLRLPPGWRPDLTSAENVAGYASGEEGAYLHMAQARARFAIATAQSERQPYLYDANGRIDDWQQTQIAGSTRLSFRLTGYQPLDFRLANAAPCQVRVDGQPARPRTETREGLNLSRIRLAHAAAKIEISCPAP